MVDLLKIKAIRDWARPIRVTKVKVLLYLQVTTNSLWRDSPLLHYLLLD